MQHARVARLLVALLLVTLLLAACSSAQPSVSPTLSASSDRIAVTLTDGFKIEAASITVPRGVPVTFVITNSGVIEHEFYIGDEAAQAEHEAEMQAMGGMSHDEPEVIAVAAGDTRELTFTFTTAGLTLAGCHETGHYAAGMKATITVSG